MTKYFYFIVNNKPDDYGNCQKELVYTSLKNAKKYYYHLEVPVAHAAVLHNYMDFVDEAEEKERSDGERFYGAE